MALDLTTVDNMPWDFELKEKREKAKKLVKARKSLLIIGSPMCAVFSQTQRVNYSGMSPKRVQEIMDKGTRHLEFCIELYTIQANQGLYFLHESACAPMDGHQLELQAYAKFDEAQQREISEGWHV